MPEEASITSCFTFNAFFHNDPDLFCLLLHLQFPVPRVFHGSSVSVRPGVFHYVFETVLARKCHSLDLTTGATAPGSPRKLPVHEMGRIVASAALDLT